MNFDNARRLTAFINGTSDPTSTTYDPHAILEADWEPPYDWPEQGVHASGDTLDTPPEATQGPQPVDWAAIWDNDGPAIDWIAEPLIAAGRLTALYSEAKVGKSLLALEVAAAIATGGIAMSRPVARRRVMYIDMENDPRGDVVERLKAMGYAPDQLGDLILFSYPDIPPLDTKAGGVQLHALAQHHQVELVIIDTVSRVVTGAENDNDTWLSFYRYTGLLLKAHHIACVRIDHAGKDATKGQRGGSAKSGDPDAIWHLTASNQNTLRLHCDAARHLLPEEDRDLTLLRRTNPLRHERSSSPTADAREARTRHLVACLDNLDVPLDYGRDKVRAMLTAAGEPARNGEISDAILRRKNLSPKPRGQVPHPDLSPTPQDSKGQEL